MKQVIRFPLLISIVILVICSSNKEDKSISFVDRSVFLNENLYSYSRIKFDASTTTGNYMAGEAGRTFKSLIDSFDAAVKEPVHIKKSLKYIVYYLVYQDSSRLNIATDHPLLEIDKYFLVGELLGDNQIDLKIDSTFEMTWWGAENFKIIKWDSGH